MPENGGKAPVKRTRLEAPSSSSNAGEQLVDPM